MAQDNKLEELLSAVKKLYEEFRVIEEEIASMELLSPEEKKADKNARKSNFPAKEQHDRFCDMEKGMREKEKRLTSLIGDLRNSILDIIEEEKKRLIRSFFLIFPTYKCERQYAESGTHVWCIEEGEVIKICGVDFSEHNDHDLYVTAKKVGVDYNYEYGISYKDLLENFEGIAE
jgi:cell fate (sporulation/competence/biofilm development) regulator YlbF (YheA/YmcA/DUF963 family)